MKLWSAIMSKIKRAPKAKEAVDIAEVTILGIRAKMVRKTAVSIPTEVSLFIPHLEIKKKIIEENKTTETSLILESLTIVSSPRHEEKSNQKLIKK